MAIQRPQRLWSRAAGADWDPTYGKGPDWMGDRVAQARRESVGELIGEVASQSASLVRDEVALAKRELQQKLRTVQSAATVVAIGTVTALIAALALCAAVIIALAEYVGPWQSALIVGLILGMIAGVILLIGVNRFKRTNLRPEQTMETLEENKAWLKDIT